MAQYTPDNTPRNVAETVRDLMADLPAITPLIPERADDFPVLSAPFLVDVPANHTVKDVTAEVRVAMSYMKPHRRKGTAIMDDLESLILWANRFKGSGSVIYANPGLRDGAKMSITAIANYHEAGADQPDPINGDPAARHGDHRATYTFPQSKEWKEWNAISGKAIGGAEMGAFLEDHILDVMDPTPALINGSGDVTDSDRRLIETAARLGTAFGTSAQLLEMSRRFVVLESSNIAVVRNTTTGEGMLQVTSEHKDADGAPIKPPGLFLIAIPVFEGGPAYRLPVRFQYRKKGSDVVFFLTLHDPKRAQDDAFTEAATRAADATDLPLLLGSPE